MIFAIVGIYRKWRLGYFVGLISLLSGISYLLLVRGRELMFWGLHGDEVTIAAMYTMVSKGPGFVDFAYTHLPAFYPPLYFWVFGFIGRMLSLNGVQVAKIATFSTILFVPIMLYLVQAWFWKKKKDAGILFTQKLLWFLSTLLLFVVIEWDAIITKPYQFVSAAGIIIWTTMLLYWVHKERLRLLSGIVFGIVGGLLFLTYYFWFFLAAIGITFFHLFYKRVSFRAYLSLFGVGALTLLVGSPFWWPLARSYRAFGTENWQFGYLLVEWLSTHVSFFTFSISSLVMLFGFGVLVWYRKRFYCRVLLSLFIASYVWQIMGLFTILFLASPMQEAKGFYFFSRSVLAFGAAYGMTRVWFFIRRKYKGNIFILRTIQIIAICFLATQLPFGFFIDEPLIYNTRVSARALNPEVRLLIDYLDDKHVEDSVTVHSGITGLHAFLPLNTFVYFNMNNSHPAALFSERLLVLDELSRAKTPEEFYTISQNNYVDTIGRFILRKDEGEQYLLYFLIDNFPHGTKEHIISFSKDLISDTHFSSVFETEHFVIFESKNL
ncbi:MAG: hypothetical protein HN726_03005 [Candidatus Magasanikbacteria bacterium]|nr:hypothetical protein [Candidatus Magasanikbacteria bacterium]